MSWWDATSGFGNLASQALKNAQQKIDKVLDIQGEHGRDPTKAKADEPSLPSSPPSSPPPADDTEFWNEWLAKDKLSALGAKVKVTSTPQVEPLPEVTPEGQEGGGEGEWSSESFSSEFFSSTISSSLSKVKSLKQKAENTSLLRKKSDAELGDRLTLSKVDDWRPSKHGTNVKEEVSRQDDRLPTQEDSTAPVSPAAKAERQKQDTQTDYVDSVKVSEPPTTPVTEPLQIALPHIPQLPSHGDINTGAGLLTTDTTLRKSKEDDRLPSLPLDAADTTGQKDQPEDEVPGVKTDQTEPLNLTPDSGGRQGGHVTDETYSEESLLAETGPEQSGWGDVSLSIITDSQISSASSATVDTTDTVTVDTTDTVTVAKDSLRAPAPCDRATPTRDTEDDQSVQEAVSDRTDEINEPDNGSAPSDEVVKAVKANVEPGSYNAWDISELTESALNVEQVTPRDDRLAADDASTETETDKFAEEDSSQTEVVEATQANDPDLEVASCTAEPATENTSSRDPSDDAVAMETVPAQSVGEKVEELPASLEDSTDTQEELSEGNRTLTAEEFNQARISSESSQATLELGPEDEEDREGEELGVREEVENSEEDHQDRDEERQTDRSSTELTTSKDNLTSSSYVKNMLEEAMVESLKDTDSHTDSHSSSDMVRIESGPTSGHTSADEIETNTSSDIEIISHISTPTPNGENRLFDLSPLRHALSRTMRRNSPPGHKRSDSSSSGQSRNGDDVLSPDGMYRPIDMGRATRESKRDNRRSDDQASHALETEKLLKANHTLTPLQPIQESQENIAMAMPSVVKEESVSMVPTEEGGNTHIPTPPLNSITTDSKHISVSKSDLPALQQDYHDNHDITKKLAETAEILDVREKKMVDLSRENMELVETVNILRQQLEQSEEAREAEMTDLNTLTEEFTKRMGEAEKKIQSVIREKEVMRKKLQDTEGELAKRANDKATERIMREKDQQIAELLEEGEKLSKQQLQSNNILKKLRVKEKENDSLLKSQKQKLDQQDTEIEKLQTVLDNKMDNEKKQNDAISQLNNAVLKQETEINRLKSELEDSVEKIRSMQVALDNSYKEIGDLHKANATRASQVQEEALSHEIKARKDLQVALEHYQQQARYEQEALLTQIEDHQLNINRTEKEHGRREDILRQEIANLQQRLQEAEDRNQELTQSVTQATRPLLRQIENLQSTYAAQVNSYEKVEKNLTERLSESQTQLALAQEKERMANDRVIDVDVKLSTMESQISILRQEKSRLQAHLEMEKAKLEVLEDTKNHEVAQLEALRQNYEHDMSELKKEKIMHENQMEMEKMKTESEKKKVIMLHEQLREKELQWVQARKAANSPTPTAFSRESSFTVESPLNLSQHEEVLEKTLMLASANGNKNSLYDSLRQAGATTIIESLQSQLKMKDGEVAQLQSDIHELERTRESMARELVSLSNMNDNLEEQVKEFPEYQAKHKDLDQRYQALLQMYGEKVEEAEELRLDLQDIKDMYKTQINELLKNQ